MCVWRCMYSKWCETVIWWLVVLMTAHVKLSRMWLFKSLILCVILRWWRRWWRWGSRGASPVLLRLRHALPDSVLEGSVRVRSAHGVLERLGLFRGVHHCNWPPHRGHRRPGVSLRLHCRPSGHCHRCRVRGSGHFYPRCASGHLIQYSGALQPHFKISEWHCIK